MQILTKLRVPAIIIGFVGALSVFAVAKALDARAVDVFQVQPHDPKAVESNKVLAENELWDGPEIGIYGNPASGDAIRVIGADDSRIIRPSDEPEKAYLLVDKLADSPDNPLQVKTVWLFSKFAIAGFILLGIVGMFLPKQREQS